MHPTWQARLRDEIRVNVQHRFLTNDPASFDAASILEKLPILNAVYNESLRLMPPSPTSNRVTKSDTSVLGRPYPPAQNSSLRLMPPIGLRNSGVLRLRRSIRVAGWKAMAATKKQMAAAIMVSCPSSTGRGSALAISMRHLRFAYFWLLL
jgi:Cytochrome P450